MIMGNNVFALATMDINTIDIAGGLGAPIPAPIKICNVVCPILQIVSALIFIVSGFSILITKAKKQPEPKKVKRWVKILFIISIILFVLSILTKLIINK